jgi:fermentation-respiration switch protein FrsA (DUF1100 family)
LSRNVESFVHYHTARPKTRPQGKNSSTAIAEDERFQRRAPSMRLRITRRRAAIAGCVFVAVGLLSAWIIGGRLLAPAPRRVGSPPKGWNVENVTIASRSGSQLAGWYVPAADPVATVVLLHPIRADRTAMTGRAKILHEAGYAVVLVDLQAHGESRGDAITLGARERFDAQAAVEFARTKNPQHRIGVIGWSLGGAAATLASPLGIDALVLEAVYPTIDEAVHDRLRMRIGPLHYFAAPLLLWQLGPRLGINRAELRPIDRISQVGCPVLVLAGELDEHTTVAESLRMYAAAAEPRAIFTFAGAKHEDLLAFDGEAYATAVLPFLAQGLGSPGGTPGH